jgi:hypothetical protein
MAIPVSIVRMVMGSFTGDGSNNRQINVGFFPIFVYAYGTNNNAWFFIINGMANSREESGSEYNLSNYIVLNSTGFQVNNSATSGRMNASGATYNWVAFG